MKYPRIIDRYLFSQMLIPFSINVVFLAFIFLMTQILQITSFIVNHGVGIGTVFRMLVYTLPFFLMFIFPMSVMMAILLTFMKLSSENEIVALKAGGISIYSLLPPVFLFCLLGSLLTAFMAVYGLPWGRLSFKNLAMEVATANVDIAVKERTFIDNFDGVMLYVNKTDMKRQRLVDVFIEDQRKKDIVSTVVAPEGKLLGDPDRSAVHLRLFDGTINQVNLKTRAVNTIRFEVYDVTLSLKQTARFVADAPKDEEEMSLGELKAYLETAAVKDSRYYMVLMEYHKKFSIPAACFALGILGVPLGIHSKSAKRSFGIILGLVFFLLYYLMLSMGWVFGETGAYAPAIGMWMPNWVFGGLGVFLLIGSARERTLGIDTVRFAFMKLNAYRMTKPE
ncbi:MAG: LPS export ABC transporter permease LptF [Deltaproteobacteria bacterium]|nr:LPS export ABC transporter permease LptF [Deltaproteobacteria bacterium]MBW2133293.1 LPS export ABC transporter permease LptF [Deltaproteobacteria bacterium]